MHDHADKHSQLPDEFVVSKESTEQKQMENLTGMQAHHHEVQILLPRSLEESQTKFRDEHSEITKTTMDLSIIQHQAELEEKAGDEQQLRKKLSMVAQDNDAKHGDVNSRPEACQDDDNLKLRNERIQEHKELPEQTQAYFSSTLEILDQKFRQELDRTAKDADRETQLYKANLQSISDFPEETLQISQDHDMLDGSDWEYRTANVFTVTDDQFERFCAKVKWKFDRHLNEYEGKFTEDQVKTHSVSSQHEQNYEDIQRKMMKSNEELIELLQTEIAHIVKTNEQSLKQAKPILRTSSRRGDPVDD